MAINGFSICSSSTIGAFKVPGTTRSLSVRREVAPLLIGFARDFHRLVEPITINPLDDWGYNCRKVRGRVTPSFHSAGIAIDLNATRHPLGKVGTFNARQRATIRALCKKYGMRWGGDYRGRKDEMHFEVIVTRSAALALARRVQAKPAATPTAKPAAARAAAAPKPSPPRLAKLKYGAKNSDIVKLQQRLNQLGYHVGTADGAYGPKTRGAVAAFQRHLGWHGSDADGHMGPHTLRELF